MAPLEKVQKMAGRSPRGQELVLGDTPKIKGEDWKHQEAAEDSQAPRVRSRFHCKTPQPELLAPSRNVPCDSGCSERLNAASSQSCAFMVPFSAQEAVSHRSFSPEAMSPGNTVKSASIGFPGKQASTLFNPRSSHLFSLIRETHFVHLFLASP